MSPYIHLIAIGIVVILLGYFALLFNISPFIASAIAIVGLIISTIGFYKAENKIYDYD